VEGLTLRINDGVVKLASIKVLPLDEPTMAVGKQS